MPSYYRGPRPAPTPWYEPIEWVEQRTGLPGRISLHESAHAAVAAATGVEVIEVAIGRGPPEKPSLHGFVRTGRERDPWAGVLIALAGEASDTFFFGRAPDRRSYDCRDARRAAYGIDGVSVSNVWDIVAQARLVALDVVRKNRDAIERLAARLDEVREMTSSEVTRILGDIPPILAPERDGSIRRRIEARRAPVLRVGGGREDGSYFVMDLQRCDGRIGVPASDRDRMIRQRMEVRRRAVPAPQQPNVAEDGDDYETRDDRHAPGRTPF